MTSQFYISCCRFYCFFLSILNGFPFVYSVPLNGWKREQSGRRYRIFGYQQAAHAKRQTKKEKRNEQKLRRQ